MAVYAIIAVRAVHDPGKLRQYAEHLRAHVGRYGGRLLAATDHVRVL